MLQILSDRLAQASCLSQKISILNTYSAIEHFFQEHPSLRPFSLCPEYESVLKQLILIGQADRLFADVDRVEEPVVHALFSNLIALDHFYREIGGICGYQAKIVQLLKDSKKTNTSFANYHPPSFIEIGEETPIVKDAIEWGIDRLAEIGEIYPLGGAADRLHLVDETTGLELPAAKLHFAGKPLLAHLIRDLEAREFLYFQKYGIRLVTPIAIMTSQEKNNHAHVVEICESLNYFGRPKESIRFFSQPLVPAVDENGDWCILGPLKPLLKPGGHGAIWKLARDGGIFSWFQNQGRKKVLVRQINNPIAGLDYGLLAFTGIGCKKDMVFGFASCPRLLQAAEGVNVLIETEKNIVLSNIEYCDFAKFGIEDRPLKEGEPYSRFSSNTNILFADLQALSQAVEACPFPGLLINLKKTAYTTQNGEKKEQLIARLESTMQNIADVFVEEKGADLTTQRTFVTYNKRHKTISTAKKAFIPGHPLQETPENCFYDLLMAHRELLLQCGFKLPPSSSLEEYLKRGPDFLFLYRPSLGPLYSVIQDKIKGGYMSLGSELILEISNCTATHLHIEGSLQIIAEKACEGKGHCILENVTIQNQGVDWSDSSPFWKMDLKRRETVRVILKGNSTFIARNMNLRGSHTFIVEDGKVLEI